MKKKLSPSKILAISCICLLLCSLLTSIFNTSLFSVKVRRVNQIGDNGANYSALIYVPRFASNKSPAPAVILVHGNSTSSTQQSSHAIELARRGYIAISMDIAGRGQSELGEGLKDAELTPSLEAWIDYALTSPIVDHEQIILSSHSMGGLLCSQAIATYPGAIDTWINHGTTTRPGALTAGYNLATLGGLYEFKSDNDVKSSFAKQLGLDVNSVEYGKIYEINGQKYTCNVEKRIHPSVFWNSDSIQQMCDFLTVTNPTGTALSGSNQIWWLRDAFSMLGLVCVLAFILSLVNALVHTEFFAIVKQPIPRSVGLPKKGFIVSAVIAVLVVFLGYGPLSQLYKRLLPQTLTLFPTILANGMLTFVLGLTVISILMGLLYYFTDAKKHNATLADLGVTTEGNTRLCGTLVWKSFVIAVIVVTAVYAWFKVMEDFTGTNFQCGPMGLQSITPLRLRIALPYMALYFINFFVSGFSHNIERSLPSTGNKKKDDIRAVIVNVVIGTLGMALYVLVAYLYDRTTLGANNTFGFMNAGLHTLFSYGLIWFMASTTTITTVCYRITGSIWTGAFVNAIYCGCSLLAVVPMTAIVR